MFRNTELEERSLIYDRNDARYMAAEAADRDAVER